MNTDEAELVQHQLAALETRATAAESRAAKAEGDAARLRALLTRVRTSMSEAFNDPAADGRPTGDTHA